MFLDMASIRGLGIQLESRSTPGPSCEALFEVFSHPFSRQIIVELAHMGP